MSSNFQNDEILWTGDRAFGDKKDRVQLEQGEYNGKPTFCLRETWCTPDGEYRWSQVRPDKNGKYWARFQLKAGELRSLGEALIAAANVADAATPRQRPNGQDGQSRRQASPKEQKEINRYEQATRGLPPADHGEDDIPF